MSLGALVGLILGFNLLTFGNGPVMVPLLQRHLVETSGVLTLDQFLYAYAIGRATPGQANLYVAAIGYMAYGWLGAAATVAAIQLPGYLVLPLVKGYERFRDVRAVGGFTRGLTAVSVSLMLSVTYDIGRDTLGSPLTWVAFGLTLGLITIRRWNALLAMVVASAAGAALKLAVG
ncbi:MAG TPA: chromate transporter [Stellaceae bacterium]|nr:chromate transporter [Stellaceae bacterium]